MSSADIHAARIAERAAANAVDVSDAPPMSPRSRLESFRAQQGRAGAPAPSSSLSAIRSAAGQANPPAASADGGFAINLPTANGGAPSIPGLGLSQLSSGQIAAGVDANGRPLSSRRLKKEILKADSKSEENSNSAGHITLRDEMGTPRSVRVVQRESFEDFNMVSVKWVCTEALPFQVELRHGRKSGIRKIYVNKELVERTKSLANLLMDRGYRLGPSNRPTSFPNTCPATLCTCSLSLSSSLSCSLP